MWLFAEWQPQKAFEHKIWVIIFINWSKIEYLRLLSRMKDANRSDSHACKLNDSWWTRCGGHFCFQSLYIFYSLQWAENWKPDLCRRAFIWQSIWLLLMRLNTPNSRHGLTCAKVNAPCTMNECNGSRFVLFSHRIYQQSMRVAARCSFIFKYNSYWQVIIKMHALESSLVAFFGWST